ncbi:hypothetical protein GUITHDRAFT_111435 [Guillardia theta CCMP2712]|uniref:Sulfotransferase domain-containing protein n=1 Tax=Guillardia theta (strain CCMP2712) TaxID=905079 RepID=L1J2D0_GUITC|nr:hypothetical protein GUITHDRAFT_111435 [Guillardia theta CCMP2712]EKX42462.1 hypothetical protein GUITHDRAFT_111435 [Guillardia theta CCMP2712]|eukprot:XP_005829442.1 hypothetical protein GUITHDRAFT_111435 [Guillardia theta CCMP2712]
MTARSNYFRGPSFKRAAANNKANIQRGEKKPSKCPYVLVNSQGGVGSSSFMELLQRSHLPMNSPGDADGFKHKNAYQFKHDRQGIQLGGLGCAKKAMVILGDPLHSIESVHRRFQVAHINKWRQNSKRRPYGGRTGLADIWKEISNAKQDTTGLTDYVNSWLVAGNENNWPELRIVNTKTLYKNATELAKYLGVREQDLKSFKQLDYKPRAFKSSAPPAVQSIFEPIKSKIDHLKAP